jgi:hypothetical protein
MVPIIYFFLLRGTMASAAPPLFEAISSEPGAVSAPDSVEYVTEVGETFEVTPENLTAPDGVRFLVDLSVDQEDEGQPTVRRLALERLTVVDDPAHSTYGPDDTAVALDQVSPDDEQIDQTLRSDGVAHVRVRLADRSGPSIPPVARDDRGQDPYAWLEAVENRVWEIEARKSVFFPQQEAVYAACDLSREPQFLWIDNSFQVVVDGPELACLRQQDAVLRVDMVPTYRNEGNAGSEIRDALQATQFISVGYTGDNGANPSWIAGVIDSHKWDYDHPAFDTCWISCGPRIIQKFKDIGAGIGSEPFDEIPHTGNSHAMTVLTQLAADLEEGQDPSISSQNRVDYSGVAPDVDIVTFPKSEVVASIQQAILIGLDSLNMSFGSGACNRFSGTVDDVNSAYKAGIFVTKSAGNNGRASACTATNPGAAAGAFVVGGYGKGQTPMVSGTLTAGSASGGLTWSSGGVTYNWNLIDAVAPCGRQDPTTAQLDDDYRTSGCGTSYAAPLVNGAALDFKDSIYDIWGSTWASRVSILHAGLLVMGDRQLNSGSPSQGTTFDRDWGAGRLRMRLPTDAGLDTPWKWRLLYFDLGAGETAVIKVNKQADDSNPAISTDVDRLRAAIWWYEPNNNDPNATASALFNLQICNDLGTCYSDNSGNPEKRRVALGSEIQGRVWELKVQAVQVPASTDPDYFFNQQTRKISVVYYFEDEDRDDADGLPSSSIQ